MTVAEALAFGRERLGPGPGAARAEASRLLEFALDRTAAWLLAHGEEPLAPHAFARFERALERRAAGEPLAYIAGRAGFYGRSFLVTPEVLVPRPESEHLVMEMLAYVRGREWPSAPRLCDVGTGSGALAVSLACELPAAVVVALDVSPGALEIAERNARAHGVAERIRFGGSDLLAALPREERFDGIVANLPYVASEDLQPAPDPTSFEPRLALDGGAGGLELYERFLPQVSPRLGGGGLLLMEAGAENASRLASAARTAFAREAVHVDVLPDYAGLERIVRVWFPEADAH